MIIFVGGIVGVIVISMYLPLFSDLQLDSVVASAARPVSAPCASGRRRGRQVIGREGR